MYSSLRMSSMIEATFNFTAAPARSPEAMERWNVEARMHALACGAAQVTSMQSTLSLSSPDHGATVTLYVDGLDRLALMAWPDP